MNKESFQRKDRILKGITAEGHFKIIVVKTTDVVKTAKKKHNLSLLSTVMLGKALTGAMLLAAELKGEERVQLRIEGSGPLGFIIAEANHVGEIRGYVKNPRATLDYSDSNATLDKGIGAGFLTFTKVLYNEAEPRLSTIELVSGDIETDLAYYLTQSEQIPSAILLSVGIDENGEVSEVGGLLVQRLPNSTDGQIELLHERLASLEPIHTLLESGLYLDDIMKKAVSPMKVKQLDMKPVDFFCRCSKERFKKALSLLSYSDLKELKGKDQEMVCHYCGNKEYIKAEEIEDIAKRAKARLN